MPLRCCSKPEPFTMAKQEHDEIKQLVKKAQVCGLQNNKSVDSQARSLIKLADQEKRMLSDEEITSICTHARTHPAAIDSIIKGAPGYVDRCKQTLICEQPHLFEEGGALHPGERSEACWRDCWNFLRVAIYATATNTPNCTDTDGIKIVRQLYGLMNVPTAGMMLALEALSQLVSTDLAKQNHQQEASCFEQALTHMSDSLHKD